ncbi:Cysteine-rich secretory protein LCCL domain-containing 1 [Taenia solium]|eukprot:TsM_000767600 transcript=TsM_000767600 gene=TsM_000767600
MYRFAEARDIMATNNLLHLACMIEVAGLLTVLFVGAHALSSEDRKSILDFHTAVREQVRPRASNMMLMRYSKELENLAERWAKQCKYLYTDARQDLGYKGIGQNIAASGGVMPTIRWLANTWRLQAKHYTYSNNSCIPMRICRHYMQMVWADSTQLGCAVNRCDHMKPGWPPPVYYLVCQYSPA